MGLTLDELKLIQSFITDKAIENKKLKINDGHLRKAEEILLREIKLKETDFIKMLDAQGNLIENDGN